MIRNLTDCVISLSQFEPRELNLPAKFASFRDIQVEAAEWALGSGKRFLGVCLPPGAGKSLWAMTISRATGLRTAILTATKALSDQYLADFGQCGLVEVRGKANYRCAARRTNCRLGPHEGCALAEGLGCTYESARWKAKNAPTIITNYAYWIRANEYGRGLDPKESEGGPDPVELLILDEGHKAMEELSRSLRVSILEIWLREAKIDYDPRCENLQELSKWAASNIPRAKQLLEESRERLRGKPTTVARDRVYAMEELKEGFEKVSQMQSDLWVVEQRRGTEWGRVWDFDCVWPGQRASQRLFVDVSKVILMSATLRPITLRMLGITKEESDFHEWPRVFPANYTPIYHIPTVRLNYRSNHEDLVKWVRRIDEVIAARLSQKGIIHTVSYSRQQYLLANSKFSGIMDVNTGDPDSETAGQVAARFKQTSPPRVLVSPSFGTGWDFPGEECRWIIVAKTPIPPCISKVMKARKERNRHYLMYLAMQDLVQSCGRGTRSETDRCEVFILDDTIRWFMAQNKALAPNWFDVQTVEEIPPLKE